MSSSWTIYPRDPAFPAAVLFRLQPDRERLRQAQHSCAKSQHAPPDKLWDAISDALARFSAKEFTNYFAAAGYEPTRTESALAAQLLDQRCDLLVVAQPSLRLRRHGRRPRGSGLSSPLPPAG